MKVRLNELGIIKHAEFEIGDLTIICGANNTGKTYATYALYGFLTFWNEVYEHDYIGDIGFNELLNKGSIFFPTDEITMSAGSIIAKACDEYSSNLPMVFGTKKNNFSNSLFRVVIRKFSMINVSMEKKVKGPSGKTLCEIGKVRGDPYLFIRVVGNTEEINDIDKEWLRYRINRDIQSTLFSVILPYPFIASIERTGAATFQKELDFTRNRLLEHVSNRDKDINPFSLISTYYDGGYALPVKNDVDFIRDLEKVAKRESVIAQNYPHIIKTFDILSGGIYKASREVQYTPDNSKVRLTMSESASSVRSLLNLGMYLRHLASPGDLLMIDEPELNLHPMNQRLMARLLAKLVNAGVRVYITTHSDYILKEFNSLIMMKNAGDNAGYIMEKFSYEENELLDANKVKAYIAKRDFIVEEETGRRRKGYTFKQADIDTQGIEIAEFDDTINIMNEIQEYLLYHGGLL